MSTTTHPRPSDSATTDGLGTARVVWMVARREIKARMLTKANIISMAVLVALIAAAAVVGGYLLNREAPVHRLGLGPGVTALEPNLRVAATEQEVRLELVPISEQEAPAALRADQDRIGAFLDGDPAAPRMLVDSEAPGAVLAVVDAAVRSYALTSEITALGGDPESFAAGLAAAQPRIDTLQDPGGGEFDGGAFAVALAMISLLFGALIGAGSLIATGVVEEKTSRVVEILLATIKPSQLLAGKILGVGVYGLFQIGVLGGALAVAAASIGVLDGLSVNLGSAFAWLIVWFLLGYTLFALLFGGFAALVSRQEDIGSVTTPLLFLLFIPFYATMFLVPSDPDGTLVRVLSQVPFFAPFMMPVRDAFGVLEPWEMPLAVALSVALIPGLVWVAARVYRRGVLHTGGRMKVREALAG